MRERVGLLLALTALIAGCTSTRETDATARAATSTTVGSTLLATSTTAPGTPGCAATPPLAGRTEETVPSGGRDRAYVRYVPTQLESESRPPLVIDLTAYSPASLEEVFSGITTTNAAGTVKADDVGAVVVTPEPVNGAGLLTWNVAHTEGWTDDVQFVSDLIDAVGRDVCLQPGRVLVMGFAIGGVMASVLACDLADRITAVATVSGLWDPPGCAPTRPVPILSFHGDDDHFLPFDGGVGDRIGELSLSPDTSAGLTSMTSRPGAVAASTAWATRNGCTPEPAATPIVDGVERRAWQGCTAAVELDVIAGGSHTWTGSNGVGSYQDLLGTVSQAVSATDLIWAFFEAQPNA